ncbi:MAG: hypothetical protein ACR2FQ_00560 [Pseudonocardiaceae bacterium]
MGGKQDEPDAQQRLPDHAGRPLDRASGWIPGGRMTPVSEPLIP